jgi:hypothetical protein
MSRIAAAFDGAAVVPPNASKRDENAREKTRMEKLRQLECQGCPVCAKCSKPAAYFSDRRVLPRY